MIFSRLHYLSVNIELKTINTMPQIQGLSSLYSCVINNFIKTPQASERNEGGFLFAIEAGIFYRSQRCVAEWDETCRSLTVLMPHSQGFPGRSDTHKHAHSIQQNILDRHDHRQPGNNWPVIIVPSNTFYYTTVCKLQ